MIAAPTNTPSKVRHNGGHGEFRLYYTVPLCHRETYEEMRAAGRFNLGYVVCYEVRDSQGRRLGFRMPVSKGVNDSISAYTDARGSVYVLTYDRRTDHIGLAHHIDGEVVGEVFFGEHEIAKVLGRRGLDQSEASMIRRLLPYL